MVLLPVDTAIVAPIEPAVITDVDGVGSPRLEGDSLLVGVDGVAGGALVGEVVSRPCRAGKVTAMHLNGAAVDLCVTIRCHG
jgi:hypothetical protein